MIETIKDIWNKLIGFLVEYDIEKISDLVRHLKWQELMWNPLLWVAVIVFVALSIWKQRISLLVLAASFVLFIIMLQNTLPPAGESIPLYKILEFVGGSVLLIAVNVYFLMLREK